MVGRVVVGFLWLIAVGLLGVTMRLPRSLDIYIKDTCVVVSRASLIGLILVVLVIPLLVVTIGWLRSTHQ